MDWPYADLRLRYRLLIDLFYSSPPLEGICDFLNARLKLHNSFQYLQLDMETDGRELRIKDGSVLPSRLEGQVPIWSFAVLPAPTIAIAFVRPLGHLRHSRTAAA